MRTDVAAFVEGTLGYRLLASEFSASPVEATLDAIENCRRRVENDADILVLIIGARYGHVPDGESRSVTNIEYSAARAKQIPIFVFVQRDVLSLVPVWRANLSADFSSTVDNAKLFEFISNIRDVDKVWTFPFDAAQDIIVALRWNASCA